MNELTLDGKLYVSSKRAAELTGYAKDYVGQLCREGRIEARLVGRNWYVLKSALETHRFSGEQPKEADQQKIAVSADWEQPHYEPEAIAEVSFVNRLEQNRGKDKEIAEEVAPSGTIEAMQDAWKDWFNRDHQEVVQNAAIEDENVEKAQNESESDEEQIVIHDLNPIRSGSETLNLRRIREYTVEEESIDDTTSDDKEELQGEAGAIVSPISRTLNYQLLKVALALIAVLAIGIGYVGSGFLDNKISSYRTVSLIAGVTLYNK